MDRSLLSIFLLLSLLFSAGHAALTFHDIWNLKLPGSASPVENVPDNLPHEEVTPLPTAGKPGDDGAGEVQDHHRERVDFGTKAWPYVYYSRRDRLGTVDWGTKSWPYVYYSERPDLWKNPLSDDAAAAAHYGRKGGDGFRH